MVNTREVALYCIMEIMEKKQYSHYVIKQVLDKYGYLEKRDRSFIKLLTEGTIERAIELDFIIDRFSKTKVKKMKPLIRSLLRMSVYQIYYMDTPDSAVCNEAVKLASKRGFSSLKGFVNGVLRSIVRGKDEIVYPQKEANLLQYLSVKYSMPEWIVSEFLALYKDEKTEDILCGLLEKRPLVIRFDESMEKKESDALKAQYESVGLKLQEIADLPYAFIVLNPDRVEALPGFFEGKIMVQDAGSMMITEFADIKEDWHIVDVCGAPGGKALHAASKLHGTGSVSVRDLSDFKVSLIEDNIDRSGLTNITAKVWDATVSDVDEIEKADLVIADLPCSGLGVIGRKADIKYRLQKEDIVEIAKLQRQILTVVSTYVKPGGKLLFSTCTLTKEENEDNAKWFANNFPFTLEKEQTLYPKKGGVTDGFYMACFIKNNN